MEVALTKGKSCCLSVDPEAKNIKTLEQLNKVMNIERSITAFGMTGPTISDFLVCLLDFPFCLGCGRNGLDFFFPLFSFFLFLKNLEGSDKKRILRLFSPFHNKQNFHSIGSRADCRDRNFPLWARDEAEQL